MSFSSNPLVERREAEYAQLPDEIVRKMKAVSSENPKEYQLKIIKRQRNISISTGDMFLVQPIDGLFYVGQVIKSNLGEDAVDPFISGCHLIVIFDQPFSSIDVDTQTVPVDYYRLLIKPCIVDAVYWKRGYFFAKGNRSVPLVDELDYGFWSFRRQSFQNLNGEPMESNPIVMGIYGVTTITVHLAVGRQFALNCLPTEYTSIVFATPLRLLPAVRVPNRTLGHHFLPVHGKCAGIRG